MVLGQMPKDYPCEYFVPFEGDDFHEGRLTVNFVNQSHCVEVDLIQKESKKILRHLNTLYRLDSEQEALDQGMQELSLFLKNLKV